MKLTDSDHTIVCYCQEVTLKTIRDELENGVSSVEELIDKTKAGIACGTCIETLEELFIEYNRAIERKR